ncbi:MAG: hypothetical protein WCP92_03305 [bacterium]
MTTRVYVVVVVGCTERLVVFRFGYVKFTHAIVGVKLANVTLVYDALRVVVCHDVIFTVVGVNEHVGGIFGII